MCRTVCVACYDTTAVRDPSSRAGILDSGLVTYVRDRPNRLLVPVRYLSDMPFLYVTYVTTNFIEYSGIRFWGIFLGTNTNNTINTQHRNVNRRERGNLTKNLTQKHTGQQIERERIHSLLTKIHQLHDSPTHPIVLVVCVVPSKLKSV
jgi:hypothetical protein